MFANGALAGADREQHRLSGPWEGPSGGGCNGQEGTRPGDKEAPAGHGAKDGEGVYTVCRQVRLLLCPPGSCPSLQIVQAAYLPLWRCFETCTALEMRTPLLLVVAGPGWIPLCKTNSKEGK